MDLVRAWPRRVRIAFGAAGALLVVYVLNAVVPGGLGPAGGAVADFSWPVMGVLAAGLCAARGLVVREERTGWLLTAAAILFYGAGWLWFVTVPAGDSFPTAGDWLWMAYYPLVYAGLVVVARTRLRGAVGALWLDGLIGALTIAAAGAVLLYAPLRDLTGGSGVAVIVAMSYALADVHQLGFIVAILLAVGPGRRLAWWVLTGAMALALAADAVYAYELPRGAVTTGDLIDVGWLALMAAPALAAWLPAGREPRINARGTRRLQVPAAFAVIALLLQAYATLVEVDRPIGILATSALLVTAARLYGAYREMRRLERAAGRDALTGLRDHGEFHATVEHHAGDDGPRPFTVVTFDLDGFKGVNDTRGHAEGDRVLRDVSDVLRRCARETDEVFRLGGDEFALLLPRARAEQASAVAERIRVAVGDLGAGVSVSYGVAEWLRHADTKDRLLLHADGELYADKARGPDAPRPGTGRVAETSLV